MRDSRNLGPTLHLCMLALMDDQKRYSLRQVALWQQHRLSTWVFAGRKIERSSADVHKIMLDLEITHAHASSSLFHHLCYVGVSSCATVGVGEWLCHLQLGGRRFVVDREREESGPRVYLHGGKFKLFTPPESFCEVR